MKNSQSGSDFDIYVDPDQVDADMSTVRPSPDQEGIHQENTESCEFKASLNEKQETSENQAHRDRTEALIHSAARAIVASIERSNSFGLEDSVLSAHTDSSYDNGSEIHNGNTELADGSGAAMYESDVGHNWGHERAIGGSISSHNDGDIDDDIFSRNSGQSARSSLNSCHDLHIPNEIPHEISHEKPPPSEDGMESVSRIPSVSSYTYPPEPHVGTPNKAGTRPPFRTPSSVRAMQMSSPTPSIFSSPRSAKRTSVSRLGTPTAQRLAGSPTAKSKTPTRFKVKKEYPLVLLHVTVFPLQWAYAHAFTSQDIPTSLYGVRDSWRLLQEKLADTVLERGILLPHPQDSYETLEERLLEALELPVHPRARILKCGHYMGPFDTDVSEESGDDMDSGLGGARDRKWCDICSREVKYMKPDPEDMQKRFRIKIYASNGLMRAGAWAAVWKEMERVDVEIEPYVEGYLLEDLERLALSTKVRKDQHEDEYEDIHEDHDEDMERKRRDEERMREIYGTLPPPTDNIPQIESPPSPMQQTHTRQAEFSPPPTQHDQRRLKETYGDSLPELLLAAIKVAMRDPRNIIICLLSAILLVLLLRPGPAPINSTSTAVTHGEVPDVIGRVEHVPVSYAEEDQIVQEPVAVIEATAPKVSPVIENNSKDAETVEAMESPTAIPENETTAEQPLEDEEARTLLDDPSNFQETEGETSGTGVEQFLDTSESEVVDDEISELPETKLQIEEPASEEDIVSGEVPYDFSNIEDHTERDRTEL